MIADYGRFKTSKSNRNRKAFYVFNIHVAIAIKTLIVAITISQFLIFVKLLLFFCLFVLKLLRLTFSIFHFQEVKFHFTFLIFI